MKRCQKTVVKVGEKEAVRRPWRLRYLSCARYE